MLPVEHGVGEEVDPVAQDDDARRGVQHQVQLDVPVPVDEEVDVRVRLQVVLGVEHQRFLVLAHVVRVLAVHAFQAAVFGPVEAQRHAPARMQGGEEALHRVAVEQHAQHLEARVRVAQTVAVGQVELLTADFGGQRLAMQDDAALPLQVVAAPDVVVADEEVHLHPEVRQFGHLAQEARVALGHDGLEFVPEVEHVAQQVDGGCLVLDAVQESDQAAFLRPSVGDGERAQVGVGEEVDVLHIAIKVI